MHHVINIERDPSKKWTTVSLCVLKSPKVDCESTLYISPACFILGGFQSEEDELDYLSSLLKMMTRLAKITVHHQ